MLLKRLNKNLFVVYFMSHVRQVSIKNHIVALINLRHDILNKETVNYSGCNKIV